ncbi:hypothetical protein DFS34DRAFT_630491 [Phlyctochytrium arcticum]|nr:hypothetical protein DFS34DRAFT_630491 [Phlyctochytrium arcticum]
MALFSIENPATASMNELLGAAFVILVGTLAAWAPHLLDHYFDEKHHLIDEAKRINAKSSLLAAGGRNVTGLANRIQNLQRQKAAMGEEINRLNSELLKAQAHFAACTAEANALRASMQHEMDILRERIASFRDGKSLPQTHYSSLADKIKDAPPMAAENTETPDGFARKFQGVPVERLPLFSVQRKSFWVPDVAG